MIRALSFVQAIIITLIIFIVLDTLHSDRIQLNAMNETPTTFYKRYRPKLKKKPSENPKKKVPKKEVPPKKTSRSRAISETITEETFVDISELNQEVVVIQKVIPKYPDIAQKSGIECNILMEVIINEKGRVISAKVIYASQDGYGFKKSALKAVQQLKFEPMLKDGVPVNVKIIYPVNFILIE